MPFTRFKQAVLVATVFLAAVSAASAQTMIVGNDEKQGADQNLKPIFREPGHDFVVDHRHFQAGYAEDHGNNPVDELGRWAADQLGGDAIGRYRVSRQFSDAGGPGLGTSSRSRRQGVCCRSQSEPAQRHRHGQGRQTAIGFGDQSKGRSCPGRQSRRRNAVGAGDQRKECPRYRHRTGRNRHRPGLRGRHHPGRPACARGKTGR